MEIKHWCCHRERSHAGSKNRCWCVAWGEIHQHNTRGWGLLYFTTITFQLFWLRMEQQRRRHTFMKQNELFESYHWKNEFMLCRTISHGDIVVPSHRTDWGLRSFAVAGPSSWNALPVSLRSSSFSLDTFAKHLKTHLFGIAYSRQGTHFWVCITFCRVRHGDSVTKPDYYYYYYYYKPTEWTPGDWFPTLAYLILASR